MPQNVGGVALFVVITIKRVHASLERIHKTVACFEERLAAKDRAIRVEVAIFSHYKSRLFVEPP